MEEDNQLLVRPMNPKLDILRNKDGKDLVEVINEAKTPDSMPGLTEGRIVHYTAYNKRNLAALIIGHDSSQGYSKVDLAVFTNMENAAGVKNFGLQFHQDVEYSEEALPGTWHWPA